jgi:hypothetical protein
MSYSAWLAGFVACGGARRRLAPPGRRAEASEKEAPTPAANARRLLTPENQYSLPPHDQGCHLLGSGGCGCRCGRAKLSGACCCCSAASQQRRWTSQAYILVVRLRTPRSAPVGVFLAPHPGPGLPSPRCCAAQGNHVLCYNGQATGTSCICYPGWQGPSCDESAGAPGNMAYRDSAHVRIPNPLPPPSR